MGHHGNRVSLTDKFVLQCKESNKLFQDYTDTQGVHSVYIGSTQGGHRHTYGIQVPQW